MALATAQGRVCALETCQLPHYGKGWCRAHYDQDRRRGFVGEIQKHRVGWSEEDRFWDQVDVRDFNGCWGWLGAVGSGRGKFTYEKGILAHRYSYQFFFPEEDIDGVTIHHKCANGLCVNPDHLQAVSLINNVAEMVERQSYLRKIAKLEAEIESLKLRVIALETERAWHLQP